MTVPRALLVFVVALALAGCPGDDDDSAPTPPADDDDATADDDDSAGDDDDSAGDDDDATPEPTTDAEARGLALYATYCAHCHGPDLEGYLADHAPALSTPSFLATATDPFLASAITHGRPGTVMSAWGADYGGPLTPAEVSDLVAWIRAWQTAPTEDVHDQAVDGDAAAAEPLYVGACAHCHGEDGGGDTGPALANPWFLHDASDGFLRYAIRNGREGTPMEPFGDLSDEALDDLTALLRSWETPVEDTKVPPFDPDLSQPVIHEGGPPADFSGALLEALYVPVEEVAAPYDAGQAMVLLDARPGSDYLAGHISGAVSVPFYRVEQAASFLPEDVWLVAYCGCPHTLSGDVAAQLAELGFPLVAVLDEGWYAWVEGGHPTTAGPDP